MLMEPQYKELRTCIYGNSEEMARFRQVGPGAEAGSSIDYQSLNSHVCFLLTRQQLVINSVIATDISDKGLSMTRKERWMKAFNLEAHDSSEHANPTSPNASEDQATIIRNRKATIVIERKCGLVILS